MISGWADAIGVQNQTIAIGGQTLAVDGLAATAVLGGGLLLLSWLAIALTAAGVRTLSWAVTDTEALKALTAEFMRVMGTRPVQIPPAPSADA